MISRAGLTSACARGVGSIPRGGAHEQRVVERTAQARECSADRGLAHPEPHGNLAYAAFLEQSERDLEQVQIEVSSRHESVSRVQGFIAFTCCLGAL
jgi:hypothetical protein